MRYYSILSGETLDESVEDISLNELRLLPTQAKMMRNNPATPVETFDFIIVEECHRSIYNLWQQVLKYFDAFLIDSEADDVTRRKPATGWLITTRFATTLWTCGGIEGYLAVSRR